MRAKITGTLLLGWGVLLGGCSPGPPAPALEAPDMPAAPIDVAHELVDAPERMPDVTPDIAPEPVALRVVPDALTLRVGIAQPIVVQRREAAGLPWQTIHHSVIAWEVEGPAALASAHEGKITGWVMGQGRAVARWGTGEAAASIEVRPPSGAGLAIVPRRLALLPGAVQGVVVEALDEAGERVLLPQLRWSSSAPEVAATDGFDRVFGISPGTTTLSARWEGFEATLEVSVLDVDLIEVSAPEVLAVGESTLVSLQGRDVDGARVSVASLPVQWSVRPVGHATLSPEGVMTAHEPGLVSITANLSGVEARAEVSQRLRFKLLQCGPQVCCGVSTVDTLHCMGSNEGGMLGEGSTISSSWPVTLLTSAPLVSFAFSEEAVCGLTAAGEAHCWGANLSGQLGDGTLLTRGLPAPVQTSARFSTLAMARETTCALDLQGALWCWGSWPVLAMPDEASTRQLTPARVDAGPWTALAMAHQHVCARAPSGAWSCVGDNQGGQLGDPLLASSASMQPLALPFVPTSLVLLQQGGCVTSPTQEVWCWGASAHQHSPQLPEAGMGLRRINAPGGQIQALLSAPTTSQTLCGVNGSGQLVCWGGAECARGPASFAGVSPARTSFNGRFGCTLDAAGIARCWGIQTDGRLTGPEGTCSKQLREILPYHQPTLR